MGANLSVCTYNYVSIENPLSHAHTHAPTILSSAWTIITSFHIGQWKEAAAKQIHKGLGRTCRHTHTQIVNKHTPRIKGHFSGEDVCGCLAQEEANSLVEAEGVCVGRGGGRGGGQGVLLQQGQRVGRTLTQRVRATAQLLTAVWVHTVYQAV